MTQARKENNARELITVEITEIELPITLMREGCNDENIKQLADSIKENGLINPILVARKGKKFELIAGYRRIKAFQMLKRKQIVACLTTAKDIKREVLKIHENIIREDVDPVSEGVYYAGIISEYKIKQKQLAKMIRVSDAYLSERLATKAWKIPLRVAVQQGEISFSAARELARIKDEKTFEQYLNHALENGITPAVAKEWANFANDQPAPMEESDHGDGEQPEAIRAELPSFSCPICKEKKSIEAMQMIRVCNVCVAAVKLVEGAATATDNKLLPYNANQLDIIEELQNL